MTTTDRLSHQNVRAITEAWLERYHDHPDDLPWITQPSGIEVGVCAPLYEPSNSDCLCGHALKRHEKVEAERRLCDDCPCM